MRDVQNDPTLMDWMAKIAGEPLIPHGNLSSCPQVKRSRKAVDQDRRVELDLFTFYSLSIHYYVKGSLNFTER